MKQYIENLNNIRNKLNFTKSKQENNLNKYSPAPAPSPCNMDRSLQCCINYDYSRGSTLTIIWLHVVCTYFVDLTADVAVSNFQRPPLQTKQHVVVASKVSNRWYLHGCVCSDGLGLV